jgi:hypothetical protein
LSIKIWDEVSADRREQVVSLFHWIQASFDVRTNLSLVNGSMRIDPQIKWNKLTICPHLAPSGLRPFGAFLSRAMSREGQRLQEWHRSCTIEKNKPAKLPSLNIHYR